MNRRFHVVTACLLGLLCALQLVALWRSTAAWSPAAITVALKPGESITLGQQELAAPQADRNHVGLRRDQRGHWFVHNASAARQLLLQREGGDRRTGATALRQGQQFRIGATRFEVDAAGDKALSFSGAGQRWRYDGATLLRDGSAQPPCPDARAAARIAAGWNRLVPQALTLARPLSFGGNLYCGNRLGLDHVERGGATLARSAGKLLLAAGAHAPLMVSSEAGEFDLAGSEETLDGVTALVAGHTRLAPRIENDRLELRPASHVALFADARVQLPPQVQWQWRQRPSWALPPCCRKPG